MLKPILHIEGPDDGTDHGTFRVRGNYSEILTLLELMTTELCCKHIEPEDIMYSVINGIREAKKNDPYYQA